MTTPSTGPASRPARALEWVHTPATHDGPDRPYLVVPRVIAGLPLLAIGLMHLMDPALGMRPLVEGAGIPFAGVVAPVAVAAEIVAGISLLLGLWARLGALLGVATMIAAVYSHLVIDVWPNGAENEPPLALPIVVGVAAALVAWRGAGRWSFDGRRRSG